MAIGLPRIGLGLNRGGSLEDAVRALFAASEQGFWLDPSDAATAFQTSTGTTAGVVGQPLGLRLDRRLGSALGAEEFTTMAGEGAAGRNANSTVTASSATSMTVQSVAAGTYGINWNTLAAVAGRAYRVTFTAVSSVARNLTPSFAGTPLAIAVTTTPTTFTMQFPAGAGSAAMDTFISALGAGETLTISDVSVKWVPGTHALQATSPSRPVWAQDGAFYRDTFDGFDDSLSIAAGGGSTTGFFYCGAIHVAGGAGTDRRIVGDNTATTGYVVRVNASDQLELLGGHGAGFAGVATVATLPVGQTHVVTAWDDGVNFKAQIDGGAVASAARPVVVAGTAAITEGKAATGPFLFFNGSLYNRIYRAGPPPDAAQRAAVQRYIASKAGVSL
jgi:hypothetical protein